MVVGLFDALRRSLPAYPCDKLLQHTTAGGETAVSYIRNHIRVDHARIVAVSKGRKVEHTRQHHAGSASVTAA